MAKLIIKDGDSPEKTFELAENVIIIGRDKALDISLESKGVSRRHAQISAIDGNYVLKDLGSTNGTFLNDVRTNEKVLVDGDCIRIGLALLSFKKESVTSGSKDSTGIEREEAATKVDLGHEVVKEDETVPHLSQFESPISEIPSKEEAEVLSPSEIEILSSMHIVSPPVEEARGAIQKEEPYARVEIKPESIKELDFGLLNSLLSDPDVNEIMVNRKDQIYVEKQGKLKLASLKFGSDQELLDLIRYIVGLVGRHIDENKPFVDARLPDGSRANAIVPPLSVKGPCITIRKFSKKVLSMDDLITKGTVTKQCAELLKICVLARKNIVVSGGTGTGKTTLLNVLSQFIPPDERIITIEDAAELNLSQEHVVTLEAKPPDLKGEGEVTLRDLLRNTLRMRPDRIIIGECRGGEAFDMLQAMNTGHEGSMTTCHSNTPRDALSRLEMMVLMAGFDQPLLSVRKQIAQAIDLIIQISRLKDGSRKITHVVEVTGMEGSVVTMQDLFLYKAGVDEKIASLKATGMIPTFIEELREKGISFSMELFEDRSADRRGR